jgi:hypothetical protein
MIKIKTVAGNVQMTMDPKTAGMLSAAVTHLIKDHLSVLEPAVGMDAGAFVLEVAHWLREPEESASQGPKVS